MKENIKKLLATMLVLLILLSSLKIDTSAAVNSDSSNQVIFVGESRQLTIKGKVVKATWRLTNKSIANVTNTGKVTAKKTGYTTVKVSYKDKNYMQGKKSIKRSFSIKVENDLKKASDSITYDSYMQTYQNAVGVTSKVRCLLTNNSKVNIRVTPLLEFYNEQDEKISIVETSHGIGVDILAGKTVIADFSEPDKEYKYYKLVIKDVYDSYISNIVNDKIIVELEDSQNTINLKANNKADSIVDLQVVTSFYKENKLVKAIITSSTLDINETTIRVLDKSIPSQNIDYDTYKISYTATAR